MTILLLIAYGINHESAASSWYLAACLFSVTNSVYFINFIELILDVISPNVEVSPFCFSFTYFSINIMLNICK